MTAVFDLDAWVAERRALLNVVLAQRLQQPSPGDDPGRLIEAMRYSLLAPGKRLRPLLALAAAEAVGGVSSQPVLIAAAAVELVHCYSLIHDDLPSMDDDDVRRGQPTCHKVFGDAIAILAGDALLTLAFGWLAEAGLESQGDATKGRAGDFLRAAAALARAAGAAGMVRGQARDLCEPAPTQLHDLERLHTEKTGALFATALEVGARVAGAEEPLIRALTRYGACFGLAFQHADDIADADHRALGDASRHRLDQLVEDAVASLDSAGLGAPAEPLRAMARNLARNPA